MSKISKEQVLHLAKLARLHLTAEEVDLYQGELASIIGFIDQLQAVDVSQLPATEQVTRLENVTRADRVKKNLRLNLSDLQHNAHLEGRHLKVPRVNL